MPRVPGPAGAAVRAGHGRGERFDAAAFFLFFNSGLALQKDTVYIIERNKLVSGDNAACDLMQWNRSQITNQAEWTLNGSIRKGFYHVGSQNCIGPSQGR